MAVSKRLRYEVLRRDNHTCRYCGATAPDVPLRIDHVTPVALGGTDTADNLVTACEPCNSGKTSTTPDATHVAQVADDAVRWAAAMKQAADNMAAEEDIKAAYREAFLAEWDRWETGPKYNRRPFELPADWAVSIERFRLAGLPVVVWPEIVDTSLGYDKIPEDAKFKYCCGIARNKIAQLHTDARRIAGISVPRLPGAAGLDEFTSAMIAAVVQTWRRETDQEPTEDEAETLGAATVAALHEGMAPGELLTVAQNAAWYGNPDLAAAKEALRVEARQLNVLMAWEYAWQHACGDRPGPEYAKTFEKYCMALHETDATDSQLLRAAIVAGFNASPFMHFGLTEEQLDAAKVPWLQAHTVDTWARTFLTTTGRWPSIEERKAFREHLWRVGDDGDYCAHDVFDAAACAGVYTDPDLSTVLTRRTSVFEAAARPLGAGGN